MHTLTKISFVFLILIAGCGFRFVDPFPGKDYTLSDVRNVTAEPELDRILTEGFHEVGSFDPDSPNQLSVIVIRFEESVAAVDSDGLTVRQRLRMEVSWRVQRAHDSQAIFGKETVTKTYPYSNDPVSLDWNRSAAIRFLANSAAQRVMDRLEDSP